MRVIYKFGPYTPCREFEIASRKIVHFGVQGGQLFVWAELNKEGRNENRIYVIVGSGMDYETVRKPIASIVDNNQSAWHLLEEPTFNDALNSNIFGTY